MEHPVTMTITAQISVSQMAEVSILLSQDTSPLHASTETAGCQAQNNTKKVRTENYRYCLSDSWINHWAINEVFET